MIVTGERSADTVSPEKVQVSCPLQKGNIFVSVLLIVLDPMISFGRPAIVKRGIATGNVFDLFLAEERRVRPVCRWMDLSTNEVNAAIRFEEQFAA